MAYACDIDSGYRVYLDNPGGQTVITASSSSPGQQQQSSSSLATGNWTGVPEAYRSGTGVVFKLSTVQGEFFIRVQGSSVSTLEQAPSLGSAQAMPMQQTSTVPMPSMQPMQPMSPMPPMQPMQPMTMGDMQMSMNPMEMRMGNMAMSMGTASAEAAPTAGTRRFCGQCGAQVSPEDRFCSSCGQALK